jgi:predicted Na+-dependent transporter
MPRGVGSDAPKWHLQKHTGSSTGPTPKGNASSRPKFLPDNFILALIGTVVLASLLPCRGAAAVVVDHLTNVAIALLFFLHGAKLSRQAVIAGASHCRLHALVLLTTFVLFPLFGLAFKPLLLPLVMPTLYAGILFLCTLPSTVPAAIAVLVVEKPGLGSDLLDCVHEAVAKHAQLLS